MFSSSITPRTRERSFGADNHWFVYLLPLRLCTAFKVGMTCNPLQRLTTFSDRYFERFELAQGLLLQLHSRTAARTTESAIKKLLADYAADCPEWVPVEAGGYTEWFAAPYTSMAEMHLRETLATNENAKLHVAEDFFRAQLQQFSGTFEQWAADNAKRVCDNAYSATLGYEVSANSRSLRNWLDAYRHFDVPIFKDDPAMLQFVRRSAELL
jgi:hypothetical protein